VTPAIRPPGVVLDIVRTLRRAGFDAWFVGCAVREALLGISDLEWDLATSATPPQVRRLFEHGSGRHRIQHHRRARQARSHA
jgi:tRNA nucleotidyltransferase/poly(A) polymerase